VFDDGSGLSEVSLTWPGGPITSVQNVSGVLAEGKEKTPWPGLEVSLRSAVSSGGVTKTLPDSSGHFAFKGVPAGFYALHIDDLQPNTGYLSKVEGDIPIRVTADAPNASLPLWGLVAGSCGLSAYTDANSIIIFGP
jgi:hypothetical protein